MSSVNDLVEPLTQLAKRCIEERMFKHAESFCNFLNAVCSSRWQQLPNDEQALWLRRLSDQLSPRALGDSWDLEDQDYMLAHELVVGLLKASAV